MPTVMYGVPSRPKVCVAGFPETTSERSSPGTVPTPRPSPEG